MSELTDLEICQKIAEIERVTVSVRFEFNKNLRTTLYCGTKFECRKSEYNPLTDYALCFKLMVKYEVCVHYGSGDVFICGGDNFDGCLSVKSFDVDDKKTLSRAICLAIIEANK